MNSKLFVLFLLPILIFGVSSSFASNEIIFDVNKSSYAPGDVVELTGQVKDSPNQLVAIEVKDTDGNTILIRTVQTDDQGNFVLKFKVPSTVKAGKLDIVANTEVNGTTVKESKQIEQSTEPIKEKETAKPTTPTSGNKNGCLIATAAFGSEMAPQVQQLRETRDNIVMKTQSGATFMTGFNSVYYSFAPTVADWEKQNPIFKEMVKATITPLLSTLSILNYVNIDSEAEMLGYGIGIILLNIGMYFVAPAFVITRIKHKLM
jgi:hypothetical protein